MCGRTACTSGAASTTIACYTLVLLGVRRDGPKELIAVEKEDRESAESWASVRRDLKRRGLAAPVLAIGDGALGPVAGHPCWHRSESEPPNVWKVSHLGRVRVYASLRSQGLLSQ